MRTQPEFGFKEHFSHIVGDMAKAVSERAGETKQQQLIRTQAAVLTIMSMLPRDAIEVMLAGHCLMFHELLTDSIHNTLRGEVDTTRRATRSGIVAMSRAFGSNLQRLERYQGRPAEGRRDAPREKPAQTVEDIVPAATAVFREPAAATPRDPAARATPPRETSAPATAQTAASTQDAVGVAKAAAIAALDAYVPAAFPPGLGANPPAACGVRQTINACGLATSAVPDRRTLLNGVSHFASQSTAFAAIPMKPARRNLASAISHSAGGRQTAR
jgi:hypothetical protein